jgi:RNA polymerase sigma-70 factor (ECF subfamily)
MRLLTKLLQRIEDGARAGTRALIDWAVRTEAELLRALLDGDGGAGEWLVKQHWQGMLRVARGLVRSEAVAAEVVQETWEAVFRGLAGFRGEASLRGWIYRILVNRARRVGRQEARQVPFSDLARRDAEGRERDPVDEFTRLGRWRSPVHGWRLLDPRDEAITRQGLSIIAATLETLPATQAVVVTMRDVEGLGSKEVCELLGISEANQRVLLHRGRTRLRLALEAAEREPGAPGGAE